MIYHSISDYIAAEVEWLNTPVKITPEGMFLMNGEKPTDSKPQYQPAPLANPDGTSLGGATIITK